MAREQTTKLVAGIAAVIVVVVIVVVLVSGGSSYTVNAEFSDAGQLVTGDLVTVAGHQVGSVSGISLSGNGLADVKLKITDKSITPLRSGTVATIGQLSLTGVANRFVNLDPGPGRPIPSGGTLPVTQTHGIVDLDIVLDALTPKVRASLQEILQTGAYFVKQPTVQSLNQLATYLNPAFAQSRTLSSELVSDRFALQRLVQSSGELSTKLSTNDGNLGGAVSNTATVLGEVASERSALADSLRRTPAVIDQSEHVLKDVDSSLDTIDPMLRALKPVAPKAAALLREAVPFGKDFAPTIVAIHRLFPDAITASNRFVPVEKKAAPALTSLVAGLNGAYPILTGIRPYAADVTAGFFNGVGGAGAGGYDANGHYLKARALLQGGGDSLTGLLSLLGDATLKIPGLTGARDHLTAACPGGGSIPAADGTAPWTDPSDLAPGIDPLCLPADDQAAN